LFKKKVFLEDLVTDAKITLRGSALTLVVETRSGQNWLRVLLGSCWCS